MMKVVINKCYGGFGLSVEALLELIKMKSELISVCLVKEYYGNSRDVKAELSKFVDFKDGLKKHPFIEIFTDGKSIYSDDISKEQRNHPDLIKVVEKLGSKANGRCASLKVVEIPDDVEFEIDEYDGLESIHETHRKWY